MRLFVSHAWEDKPLALELVRLPEFVQAWVDIRELLPGEKLDDTIGRAIEDSHVFIVLLSRRSVSKRWVAQECELALAREQQLDRVFVLPVVMEAGLDLAAAGAPFAGFADRLCLQVHDTGAAGMEQGRRELAQTLFHWASDWLDRAEPPGGGDHRFVERLEADLTEYQVRVFEVKAVVSWPLASLVTDESVAVLDAAKNRYNAYTETFMPRLAGLDREVRRRFGPAAQRSFLQLVAHLRDRVFHGAAFALNDVIESINAYEAVLRHDPAAFAAADSRRAERVAALQPAMDELVRRTSDFIGMLE